MRRKRAKSVSARAARVFAATLALVVAATAAPKFKVLHAFGSRGDGGGLWGSLVFDVKGNLYGTTSGGGGSGHGTVFELTPKSNGQWSETTLHSFPSSSNDGSGPMGTLVFDAAGNLYGTTEGGGGSDTYGTVFELTSTTAGWTEIIIYRFVRGLAGSPGGPLIMDKKGNLYGTAFDPFELAPDAGAWTFTLLHNFPSFQGDGIGAFGLVMDASRNLYGITNGGGTGKGCGDGCGTAYELHPTSGGNWKEHILHDFGTGNDDMAFPGGVLILDGVGNLYGVAPGGAPRDGVVYRLSRSHGHWETAIQYSFTGGAGGANPAGGLVMDKSGNFYGVAAAGGDPNCDCGVVYKLAPTGKGKWKYTVLHRFTGYDGAQPDAALILDSKGNLYGTTVTGGAGGAGVVFELTP